MKSNQLKIYSNQGDMDNSDKQWKTIYKIGAVTTIIVLCGIILDMVVGTVTGGNIAELPQTAIE
jgi:hypothetical protein